VIRKPKRQEETARHDRMCLNEPIPTGRQPTPRERHVAVIGARRRTTRGALWCRGPGLLKRPREGGRCSVGHPVEEVSDVAARREQPFPTHR
jgi:hypothetical protein